MNDDIIIRFDGGFFSIGARYLDGDFVTAVPEGEPPSFYSVYESYNDEPSMWLADFKSPKDASTFVKEKRKNA